MLVSMTGDFPAFTSLCGIRAWPRTFFETNMSAREKISAWGDEEDSRECCFSKLKQFRRVATRYEKTARNYHAVVTIAAIVLWLR